MLQAFSLYECDDEDGQQFHVLIYATFVRAGSKPFLTDGTVCVSGDRSSLSADLLRNRLADGSIIGGVCLFLLSFISTFPSFALFLADEFSTVFHLCTIGMA